MFKLHVKNLVSAFFLGGLVLLSGTDAHACDFVHPDAIKTAQASASEISKAATLPTASTGTGAEANSAAALLKSLQSDVPGQHSAFTCQASGAQKDVQKCVGRIDGYPQPVLIYVPGQINESKSVNLVYHFHGYNMAHGADSDTSDPQSIHFDDTKTKDGDFASWMDQGKLNGVLIAPLSQGNDSTFRSYFASAANTNHFFQTTQAVIKSSLSSSAKVNISLTSHSGADHVINEIADNLDPSMSAQITHIGLFDSMYAPRNGIAHLIASHQISLFDSYLKNGSTSQHQPGFLAEVKAAWQEKNAGPMPEDKLQTTEVTDSTHWKLMGDGQYSQFLSGLSDSN